MMLIPPQLNLGTTSTGSGKEKYFSASGIYPSNNSISSASGSGEVSPGSTGSRSVYPCPSVDGRMFAPKMQSDMTGFHMYAAAAVVTGQPGSSAFNSPATYAAAPTHSIVPPHYGSPAIDPSSYYAPLGSGYDMKGGDMWSGGYNQQGPAYYQYETGFGSQYPYDRYCGMDMNDGARRKNATRESTNTLKAWLQEHKKNPYPTKGEKIMLAIITKMTLTQVSTWFANARRRLKKENKMTWIPKNRANESGSGTDDRRPSDDKDTDEKSDDEDCKSDGEEDVSDIKPDVKPDGNSSCQFEQHNPSSLHYQHAKNASEIDAQDTMPATEQPESKPTIEYGRMISDNNILRSGTTGGLTDKLPNVDMPPVPRYDSAQDGYNGHIWSPIDSHPHKNLSLTRSYHAGYGQDYQYQYHQENDSLPGRRLSMPHQHSYPPAFDMPPLPHHALSQSSQDGMPLHNHSSTPANAGKLYSPLSSENAHKQINVAGGAGENDLAHPDSARGNNEYPYPSPVTNLRNWVNGVFHPPSQSGITLGSCSKTHTQHIKSPNPHSEVVGVSPNPSTQYQDPRYDQRYLHNAHSTQDGTGHSYMLQQRPLPSTYNTNYYHEPMNTDIINSYPPQSTPDTNQHTSGAYYSHQSETAQNHSLISGTSIDASSRNRTSSCATQETFVPGSSSSVVYHGSPPACQQAMSDGLTAERRSSTCQNVPYYNNLTDGSTAAQARSTVPPPPYANQCKFGNSGPQSQTYVETCAQRDYSMTQRTSNMAGQTGYDNIDSSSNQSTTSPRTLQTGTAREGVKSTFGCTISSDDEGRDIRKMNAAET